MYLRFAALFVAVALSGCASSPVESAYNLGVHAFQAKDYREARTQWSKAIDGGDILALNNLGYLLYYGLGGKSDQTRASELWRRAAMQGNSESQWHLGTAYESGEGVEQSYVEAYAWYRCSVAATESALEDRKSLEAAIAQDANKSLHKLLERIPAEQFALAEHLAKQYISAYSRRKAENG